MHHGEYRLVVQQLPAHTRPMRTLPRVHEHGAGTARTVMRTDDTFGNAAVCQRIQLLHRVRLVAGADGGELSVALTVIVECVRHIGQPHLGARASHPCRERAGL